MDLALRLQSIFKVTKLSLIQLRCSATFDETLFVSLNTLLFLACYSQIFTTEMDIYDATEKTYDNENQGFLYSPLLQGTQLNWKSVEIIMDFCIVYNSSVSSRLAVQQTKDMRIQTLAWSNMPRFFAFFKVCTISYQNLCK